jgi:dTDP-4-dehydrorhamnose 3,5-epimerase-like enzyme
MKFNETNLTESFLISLEKSQDERGFFARFFVKQSFQI